MIMKNKTTAIHWGEHAP